MNYINVVGYGVNAVEHLILEAIMVLERSEVVLALATKEEMNVLRRYCLKIVSITSLYKDGDNDLPGFLVPIRSRELSPIC